MPLTIKDEPVPLSTDQDGVVRVADTRVTLDTIVASSHEGATAEGIAQRGISASLAAVHAKGRSLG